MSIFNKDPARTLKYILITVWLSSGSLAVATAMVEEPQNKKLAFASDSNREAMKGAQLRCWQDGSLLFEANSVGPAGEAKAQMASFNKNANNSNVYISNDQNSLCELRSSR
ncbi:MAG: hypothetical protein RL020_312 [Pseudomonadota bacterium]|jgi:hypothetical protein